MGEEGPTRTPSLAAKLDRLFKTAHRRGEREVSYREVAETINGQGGPTISPNYIYELRTGKADNPRKAHLEALARAFDVSPVYFYEGEAALEIHQQLETLMAMRDARIRTVAERAADVNDEGLQIVCRVLDQWRRADGLRGSEEPRRRAG